MRKSLERRPQPRQHNQKRIPLRGLEQVINGTNQGICSEQDRSTRDREHSIEKIPRRDHQFRCRAGQPFDLRSQCLGRYFPDLAQQSKERPAEKGDRRLGRRPLRRLREKHAIEPTSLGALKNVCHRDQPVNDTFLLFLWYGRGVRQGETGPIVTVCEHVFDYIPPQTTKRGITVKHREVA